MGDQVRIWERVRVGLMTFGAIVLVAGVALAGRVLWTGLRASAQPSRLEVAIARAIRNAAIPRRERRETNPLPANAENLQAGRDEFRARCSNCHGIDGSGLTPVAGSLYPR